MEITAKKLDSVQPYHFNVENFDEIKSELLKFQLTPNQIKVFFYLGKFVKTKTANEISKNLHIPRTKTLTNFQNPVRGCF